jgi:hypothetical protein
MAVVVDRLSDLSLAKDENPFAVGTLPGREDYLASELHAEILKQARQSCLGEAGESRWSFDKKSVSPIFKYPSSSGEIDVWLATVLYASRAAVDIGCRDQRFDQILLGTQSSDQREAIETTRRDLLYQHGDLLWQEDYFDNVMFLWATVLTLGSLCAAAGVHSIFVPYTAQVLPPDFDPLADAFCGYLIAGLGIAGPPLGFLGCAYTLLHADSTETLAQKALSYLAQIEQQQGCTT